MKQTFRHVRFEPVRTLQSIANVLFFNAATQSAGTFMIFYFLVFIICSGLLVQGVRKEYRGLFFPWMIIMLLLCLFMAGYGLWLLIDYYIVSAVCLYQSHSQSRNNLDSIFGFICSCGTLSQ